ncbi:uncharacterized protein LOC113233369 [Hyposmocoma kahamanoa]|uniref:uncharacterized protein LOC113233369 n=1 Tax=Hyposmocoma kahamanoa TaxID=1477025 RepID=UPI000E6D87AF|nr:uncharacterized protein LOC113233369 [Hyposmocoma kahamanoa]
MTVDNATAKTKFIYELGKLLPHFDSDNQHFRCIAHILNLGAQDLLNNLALNIETDSQEQEQQCEDEEEQVKEYVPNISDSNPRHKSQTFHVTMWGQQLKSESLRKFEELYKEYKNLHAVPGSPGLPRHDNEVCECDEDEDALADQESRVVQTNSGALRRLNLLEQHARETNVEINGIPEHKPENHVSVFKQLSSAVSRPIADTNVLFCTRVRKMDDSSERSCAIVVKLPSTEIRDEILAAVAKFNKATPSEKLHSGHLGYGGKTSPIFVSEHLAPYYKALHARTRHVARDKDYKYVWIRNGRIFVRKNDQSPAKQIKSYENLNNL